MRLVPSVPLSVLALKSRGMRGFRTPVRGRLLLGALLLVAGACTGGDGNPGSAEPPATASPASEGSLRLGIPEEPASLDPFDPRSRAPAAVAILGEVLPQLFRVDPEGRARGFLADEETVREEPGTGVASFSLRSGARWSDGTPITTEDLRFTLETIRSGAWPGPRVGYDQVTAVEGQGVEVVLRFDGPFPGWRRLFSGEDFVLPAHRLRGKDLKAEWPGGPDVTGGPFRLGKVTPGLEVVLEGNEQWWGGGLRVKALRLLVVPDVRTMEQLLGRGELDVVWPPAGSNRVGRFRALDGVEVSVAEPGGRVVSLVANTETLSLERRRALLGLPDRDRFVDVLLAGEARRATSLASPAGGSTWLTVEPGDERELDEGVEATLVAAEEDPMAPLLGRVLESEARAGGATVELKYAEARKVDGSWLPEGRFDLAVVDEVAWPEPCWRCRFGEAGVGRGNVARVKGLEELAAAAERGEAGAVAALEARLRAEAVLLPLWRPSAVLAARGVEGVVANSWSTGPFWGAEDWTPAG